MHRMGFAYDWSLEITTCEPEYYRWNQWFFLKMMERGLAYRKKALVNWCPECGTVLANEQVVDGCCWRHETTPVEQRALEQWFWKITDYAEELLRDIDDEARRRLAGARAVDAAQLDRDGRKARRSISSSKASGEPIRVFTTRVDTIYGATCVILAPEHPLAQKLLDEAGRARAKQMIDARAQQGSGRCREGRRVHRRITRSIRTAARRFPIWIGNFVLMDYGTGAIMAVPAHDERDFEFCTTYGLPIRSGDSSRRMARWTRIRRLAFTDDGIVENGRANFPGLPSEEARRVMNRTRRARRLRQGGHHVSHQGLGNFAAALLGHADSGDPLPEVRRGSGAGEGSAGDSADRREDHGQGAFAAGRTCRSFMNVKCPKCGDDAPARERHHGHVRRFVLVFLSLLRSAKRSRAVRSREGRRSGFRWTNTSAA